MRRIASALSLFLFPAALLASAPLIGWTVRPADPRRGVVTAELNLEFEAAAVTWFAEREIPLRIRVAGGDWVTPAVDDDLTMPLDGRWATAIVHFGAPHQALEYAFDAPDAVGDLMITFFVPPDPARAASEIAADAISSLGIVSRTQWGCPDGQSYRGTPAYTTVTHVIVHHTAGSNALTDWAAEVRSIWYYHTASNGWDDVGYHWLIDPNGVIYEGRAGGDGVLGAHFSCRNSNTAGIALLGTFSSVSPTEAALASLTRLTGEVAARWDIDPAAFVFHAPSKLNLQTVSGHRDGNTGDTCTVTECPGDRLYAYLPVLRTSLASCDRPAIVVPRDPVAVQAGGSVTLTAAVSGTGPRSVQWFAGAPGDTSSPLEGATTETLTVAPAAGTRYWLRVTNACGAVDSDAVVVTIGERSRTRVVKRGA